MKKHIKAFAALCSLAMVFTVFSAFVFADGTTEIDQTLIDSLDGHMPVTSGNYVLTDNVSVSDTAQIAENEAVINIDLNGYTITYSGTGSMYIVGLVDGYNIVAGKVQLTIGDSAGGGLINTAKGYKGVGSTDHWISYNSAGEESKEKRGGCVLIQNSSTFTLTGGTIYGFHSTNEGGAVHVSNGAHFVMTGGTITKCSSNHGGAVSVHTASGGRTNTATSTTYNVTGSARLEGGTITGNTATLCGGGVRVLRGDLYIGNCEITGNTSNGTGGNGGGGVAITTTDKYTSIIEIEGAPKISGNTGKNADRKDLFFTNNESSIQLAGNLDSAAEINFGANSYNTNFKYFKVNNNSYDISSFKCASTTYETYYNSSNDAIMIREPLIDPSFTGFTVSVSGSIVLNAQLNLGSFDDDTTTVSYSYSYTKKGTTKNIEKTLSRSELAASGSDYLLKIPVESACMTAPIEIVINYGTEGKTVTSSVSVEDYANVIIENKLNTYTAEQQAAAKALLIYGGYAQVQLQINDSADQLPTVDGVDFSLPYADNLTGTTYAPTADPSEAYYGASLNMLSESDLKLYFKKSALGDDAPTMTVTYDSGEEQTISGEPNGSNYYMYTIKGPSGTGFAATQYETSFSYSVGNVTGEYSILTYLQVAKERGSDSMKNLAEAYAYFAEACKSVG